MNFQFINLTTTVSISRFVPTIEEIRLCSKVDSAANLTFSPAFFPVLAGVEEIFFLLLSLIEGKLVHALFIDPLNPEKSVKRKFFNISSFSGNHHLNPWTAFHSILSFINNILRRLRYLSKINNWCGGIY